LLANAPADFQNKPMKLTRASTTLAATILSFHLAARAELKLPAIFGDNMVLQQQLAVPVWGWSEPGAAVTVKFAGQSKATHADASGRWLVKLGKLKASFTPQNLLVEASEKKLVNIRTEAGGDAPNRLQDFQTKTFTNILVGEVWLASGQSNMEKPIGKQPGQKPTFNAEQELAAADYPNLRIFKIEKMLDAAPRADLEKFIGWQACNSNALDSAHFSAAAYFFGREIHTNLNVPVGLIESSWGGTRIEPWTPPMGFESVPSLARLATPVIPEKIPNTTPTVLYNAMIAPITGYALRGALWYQGESNRSDTNYDAKMSALVNGWRQLWHEGEFPFYFVQIAPYTYIKNLTNYNADTDPLPWFWLSQSRAARHIKNAGMIVTTDLVNDLNDIHPRNKTEVGHRLALLALNQTYGEKKVVCAGPAFRKAKFTGGKAILHFDNVDGGLMSKDGQPLTWFAIAGADGKFVPAAAKIVGDTVEVSAADVPEPKIVRFAWDQTAQPNFCNAAGLPAEPFRTDAPVKW
jgi:sialate O-acetylesterase